MPNPFKMDQYIGTYYLINRYGNATSTPIRVVSTRGHSGIGTNLGYLVLADRSVLKCDVFLALLAEKKLVREYSDG